VTTTLQSFVPALDGRHVVIALSAGGRNSPSSASSTWTVARCCGKLLSLLRPHRLDLDSTAFFYDAGKVSDIKSLEIEQNRKTRVHKLGSDFTADPDIFSNESNPELGIFRERVSRRLNRRVLPGLTSSVRGNGAERDENVLRPRGGASPSPRSSGPCSAPHLTTGSRHRVLRRLCLRGDPRGAPKYKLVRTSIRHPDWKHAETVIAEAADSIQSLAKSKSFLFVTYSNGVVGRIVEVRPRQRKMLGRDPARFG